MTLAADLFALQETDTAIETCDRELEQIRATLGESEVVAEARAIVAEQEARRHAAEAQARHLDGEFAILQAKIRPIETKLYDGSVRNPKELQSLQEELEMQRRRQRAIEDQQLAVMEEREVSAARLTAACAALQTEEVEWRQGQQDLTGREAALVEQRARLLAQREVRAARLDAPTLALYERLRRTKRGLAVVKVERGACRGCRITLPTTLQQRARSGLQVVQCPSCERILFAG